MERGPLHWSERAKMYPGSFKTSGALNPRPTRNRPEKKPRGGAPNKTSSRKGFLIVLLILLVCAAAAAVVFFWYLPSRHSDGVDPELQARNLVRQAMLTIDEAYADAGTYEPKKMDPASLNAIAPDMTFSPAGDTSAATSPTALAANNTVDYAGTQTSYAVGTVSSGGTAYGVLVNNADTYAVTYYLNGQEVEKWEKPTPSEQTSPSEDRTVTTQTGDTDAETSETSAPETTPVYTAAELEALMLLRDSMITIESAYATLGTYDPSQLTAQLLHELNTSVTFVPRGTNKAATDPRSSAEDTSIDFWGTAQSYALGVRSQSGTTFGVVVDTRSSGSSATYYVNGEVNDWSDQLPAPVIGHLFRRLPG